MEKRVGRRPARQAIVHGRRAQPLGSGVSGAMVAFIVVVAALAIIGGLQSAGMVASAGPAAARHAAGHDGFRVGDDISTSFGTLAVEAVHTVKGLTGADLGGMSHGVQNLVSSEQRGVQVLVSFTNLRDYTVPYAPSQFDLMTDASEQPSAPLATTFGAGDLQPYANLSGTLSFAVPAGTSRLLLRFHDGTSTPPTLVDLGELTPLPPGDSDGMQEDGPHGHGADASSSSGHGQGADDSTTSGHGPGTDDATGHGHGADDARRH